MLRLASPGFGSSVPIDSIESVSVDWLIDWLVDWSLDRLIDWSIDWFDFSTFHCLWFVLFSFVLDCFYFRSFYWFLLTLALFDFYKLVGFLVELILLRWVVKLLLFSLANCRSMKVVLPLTVGGLLFLWLFIFCKYIIPWWTNWINNQCIERK